jgi:hypothetical protein
MKQDNIIFLDIDGVLNHQTAYHNGHCKYVKLMVGDVEDSYSTFCPTSKALLNKLIEETNAKVVISSSWRLSGEDFMQAVWKAEGMSGEIIGITPYFNLEHRGKSVGSASRGEEIKWWLNNVQEYSDIFWNADMQNGIMEKSGLRNYIIIDDDSDMLYNQREHFVHVLPSPRNYSGFSQEHYEKAKEIFSKNILELNYKDLMFQ